MHQIMTTDEIVRQLLDDDNAAWTYEGARALAEYLEGCEDDAGGTCNHCGSDTHRIEFDRVALRCEFSEHASALEAARQQDPDFGSDLIQEDDDREPEDKTQQLEDYALDWLRDRTTVLETAGGSTAVVVQQF